MLFIFFISLVHKTKKLYIFLLYYMKRKLLFQLFLFLFINYGLYSQNNKHNEYGNINTGLKINEDNVKSLNLIKTKDLPVANFNVSDSNICVGQYLAFTDISTNSPYYFKWTFEGGTPSFFVGKYPPYIYYYNTGSYSVGLIVVSLQGGDTLTKTKFITVTECAENYIFIPNIFTPNEDGQNDVFYVISPYIKTMNMQIYDRWGKKVFELLSLVEGWNGEIKGQKAEQGTYVYYIDVEFKDGEIRRKKGNFSLIR